MPKRRRGRRPERRATRKPAGDTVGLAMRYVQPRVGLGLDPELLIPNDLTAGGALIAGVTELNDRPIGFAERAG